MATPGEDAESRLQRNVAPVGALGDPNPPRGSTRGPRKNTKGQGSSNGKQARKNSLRNSRRGSGRGTRSGGGHVTDRKIEARRRKEKIRRRRRKRNRCALIERAIDRLERQPEVEFRAPLMGAVVTCRDVSHFVVLFSVVLFLRSAVSRYTVAMLDQLRVGYQFSASDLDLVKGTELVGFVLTVIFVALFGRRSHRPVLVACGVLVLALGAIVWPVPYFVTSTQPSAGLNLSYGCDPTKVAPNVLSTVDVPAKVYGQLCKVAKNANSTSGSGIERCSSCPKEGDWYGKRDGYLYVVGLAGFLMGFGTGLFLTSGTLYIEEASRPTDVPLKYGFLFFMSGLGEFLGSCFAWWFSIYPENLKAGVAPQPWSVRAWWLGLVVFACLLFAVSWVFLLFPKWMVEPTWSIVRRQARLARLTKALAAAKLDRRRRREQKKRAKKRPKQTTTTTTKNSSDVIIVTGQPRSSTAPAPAAPAPAAVAVSNDPEPVSSDESDLGEENLAIGDTSNVDLPASSKQPQRSNNNSRGVSFGDVTAAEERVTSTATATGNGSGSGSGVAVATAPTSGKARRKSQDVVSRILSQCFSAVWRLISDPTYLLAIVSFTLAAYLPAGYRTVMTQFVRSQFFYNEFSAFFYADGLSYSLANAIGSFAGGFIVWKLQLSMPKQLRLIISVLAINILFFFLLFAVGCWRPVPASYQSAAVLSSDLCSGDCDCSGVQWEEVCSPDGVRFPSPCSAGCTSLTLRDSSLVYASCKCVSSDQSSVSPLQSSASAAEVSAAFCTTCSSFGGYWVLLFLAVIAHSMGYVSFVLYFLRIVKEDDRQLSLSFAVWIIALGAYVPGTAVFRGIGSSSCGTWKNDCFDEPVCWSHDLDRYRYVIHGANIVFQFVALVGFVFILFLLGELPPCRKQQRDSSYSFEEFDLGEGRIRPLPTHPTPPTPLVPAASSTSGTVLLTTTTTDDFAEERFLREANNHRGQGDGASYSSPVFDAQEDFSEFQFVSYGKPNTTTTSNMDGYPSLEVLMGDLETSRTRDYVMDVDRLSEGSELSGESSL